MERNIQRINGLSSRLHTYSDAEIDANIGYAVERRANAQHDIDTLQGEQHRRSNVELPLGELATVHYLPSAETEITPPPAA